MSAQLELDIDDRTGADVTHVLMPNMAYACGGSILTKRGSFRVGSRPWGDITCPECRSVGKEAVRAETTLQQGRQEAGK